MARDGTLYLFPLYCSDILSAMNWTYMCCHSFTEFVCVVVMFCLENTVPLESVTASGTCILLFFHADY